MISVAQLIYTAGHPDALMYFKSITVWLHSKKITPFFRAITIFRSSSQDLPPSRTAGPRPILLRLVREAEQEILFKGSDAAVLDIVLVTAAADIHVLIEQVKGRQFQFTTVISAGIVC